MRTRMFASLTIVCLLLSLGVTAQDRGTISGVVVDAQGAVLPGVSVIATGPDRRTTVSGSRGEFAFAGLLPGVYELRFVLSGFTSLTQSVTLGPGGNQRVTARMVVGTAAETVTVTGSTPSANAPSAPSPQPQAAPVFGVAIGGGTAKGIAGGVAPHYYPRPYHPNPNTESYARVDDNAFRLVAVDPLSTFSIDVDTASYANVRRFLNDGSLPPADAVRIEEMINYFRFSYPQPTNGAPFSVTTDLAECPWNPKHRLALVGLQGREMPEDNAPARNLVFLIDVSGSMQPPDKLPLLRNAMRMLSDVLTSRDRVAIVVYAGSSGVVLPSTPGDRRERIHRAIAELEAGGSTNGGAGIHLAYRLAREHFIRGGVNRVILATDGDFNVGVTSHDELVKLIERERASGVFLSVLGVGTGNLKDSTMEMLADKGNGNYSYLDSLQEARKVLVHEAGSTLVTIAKDVKIQVEFNPNAVAGYRLIGYENRMLRNEDFNDDKKDAGEIGAGHSVTALYEIVPKGVEVDRPAVDPLKYQTPAAPPSRATVSADEMLTVKLRYKAPDGDESRLISRTLMSKVQPLSANLGFASAVAEVGMLLRQSTHAPAASYDAAIARARKFRNDDPDGYRAEFIKLAELASSLGKLQTMTRRQ
jgi:Ca-activated chloride channel homolog